MKRTLFVLLLFAAAPTFAAETPPVVQAPSSPRAAVLPYQELRQIVPVVALGEKPLEDLRARAAELDGQIVELQGPIIGVVGAGAARRVVMQIDGRATLLTSIDNLDDSYAVALKSGAFARVLARIAASKTDATGNGATSNNDVNFTILAATNQPAPPALSILPDAPAPALPADETALPPMTELDSSEALNRPQAALIQIGATPADSLAQFIAAYKPFHKEIIRRHNKKLNDAQVEEIAVAVLTAGYKYNMDPRFLAAIIAVESDYDIYCLSKSGAMGLGQLMPFNLKEAGITDAWNPTQNVMGTARLLRGHLDDYKGRKDATLLAVAAYNAGPGAVRRAGYKVPDGAQVRRYVWKVYYRYKAFAPDMF